MPVFEIYYHILTFYLCCANIWSQSDDILRQYWSLKLVRKFRWYWPLKAHREQRKSTEAFLNVFHSVTSIRSEKNFEDTKLTISYFFNFTIVVWKCLIQPSFSWSIVKGKHSHIQIHMINSLYLVACTCLSKWFCLFRRELELVSF